MIMSLKKLNLTQENKKRAFTFGEYIAVMMA
jgi:hypothetical protein